METLTTPRPTRRDPEIIRKAAEKLAPEVQEWMGDSNDLSLEEITEDIAKAIRWDTDGYKIARNLDDYDPDAALVEILDGADSIIYTAHQKACEAWVEASGIQAPQIGMKVAPAKEGQGVGEVVSNHPNGQAVVCYAALGHVKEGMGCRGFYVDWEKLKPFEENVPDVERREPASLPSDGYPPSPPSSGSRRIT